MEIYKTEVENVIEAQNKKNVIIQDELDRVKNRNNYLYPGLALLLGIISGTIINK